GQEEEVEGQDRKGGGQQAGPEAAVTGAHHDGGEERCVRGLVQRRQQQGEYDGQGHGNERDSAPRQDRPGQGFRDEWSLLRRVSSRSGGEETTPRTGSAAPRQTAGLAPSADGPPAPARRASSTVVSPVTSKPS